MSELFLNELFGVPVYHQHHRARRCCGEDQKACNTLASATPAQRAIAPVNHHGHLHLSVDFVENEKNYELHADLPGYNKDDIHVHVEEGVLSVEASKTDD